ncbi:MAG: adenosylmethionine-8-amino-7-oxononanoate aminotransferase [Verrucomicrobiales bacterium]
MEPLIQGANRMRTWPPGMLAELSDWCERQGVLLIVDEVMTGFGRTGTMFACEQEGVTPDIIALAKGLTGGYLPLAATLASETIYEAFLGEFEESKTFFYGHSYCGNPLGCAAALANLEVFREENTLAELQPKIALLQQLLAELTDLPNVFVTRQCGFIAAIDLCQAGGDPFPAKARTGSRVCEAARAHGLLTRPILDTIVLMPPLCTTAEQLGQAVSAIREAVAEVCDTTS